jgi:succinyl-diaminopimelate desuccinylase
MSASDVTDPVELARELIRRPSVTPADAGAMDIVQSHLTQLGFTCRRLKFGEIENLYARRGGAGRNLCFAGHTDVVPVGDDAAWTRPPFAAELADALIWGRGAVDMKSAIAAFISAAASVPEATLGDGALSLLITGDEEGVARDGTRAVVELLQREGERIDHCLVGEPTSAARLGDMIKIGRRGSLNAWLTVEGVQGHVAYPDRAANPAPVLVRLLQALDAHRLDEGYPEFQPSNLEITEIEIGNPAQNIIPARARARINIRFNPAHRGADLIRWLEAECRRANAGFRGTVTVDPAISGEAFLTAPDDFVALCAAAIEQELSVTPVLSTTGGTSDARFIRDLCPVIEFGLVGTTMHQVDERVPVEDITALSRVYRRIIEGYFGGTA